MNHLLNRHILALLLVAFTLPAMACSEEPDVREVPTNTNPDTGDRPDAEEDAGDVDEQPDADVAPDYEAGAMDGRWSLTWVDDSELFGHLTIVHDVDAPEIVGTFEMTAGTQGELGTTSYVDGEFGTTWEPFPGTENENEVYTIIGATFAEGSDELLEGRVIGVTFDRRNVAIQRVDEE